MAVLGLPEQNFITYFSCLLGVPCLRYGSYQVASTKVFAIFFMLLSMIFPTFIAAIFYEVAATAFLQFDVINFRDAAVCANIVVAFSCAAHYLTIDRPMLYYSLSLFLIDRLLLDDGNKTKEA